MSVCLCVPGTDCPQYCPRHWPDYADDAFTAVADVLETDREAIATAAINTLGELLLPHVPAPYRAVVQQLWTQFAPVAVERAVVHAQSVQVVDERGSGSVVDLVDERPETPS